MSRSFKSVMNRWIRLVSPSRSSCGRLSAKPRLEWLEERLAPAVYLVKYANEEYLGMALT
jgi:hypothetical protein